MVISCWTACLTAYYIPWWNSQHSMLGYTIQKVPLNCGRLMATVGSFALRGVLSQLTPDIFPAFPHISSTIPKHTKDKTALNSNYLFKIPCIAIALVAGGFAGKLSSREFHWNKHYIPGRQLLTAARIQQRWPGRWEHFCDQLMPGFRMLQAQV